MLVRISWGTLLHCWWECKLVQPLWKAIWGFLKKLKIEIPFYSRILLLGIYSKKTRSQIPKDICTPMFIAALFTIAKKWKQPKCRSVDERIKKIWYIYIMEYYSAIRKEILPFATTWMELEGIILSEISQAEKAKYQVIFSYVKYKNKEKTEGTEQEQTHRTQEWTNCYQRERG